MFSEIVAWKALGEVQVQAADTRRAQRIAGYCMEGQPEAVFGTMLAAGRYFTEGETDVCLLDRETVRTLFGDESVLGMEVRVDQETFEIEGVLDSTQKICVIPGTAGEETFDGLAAEKVQALQSSNSGFEAMEAAAEGAGRQRADGQLYYVTACFGGICIAVILLIFLTVKLKKYPLYRSICLLAIVGIITGGWQLASPGSDYLPSYWSDFDFWAQLFREKADQIQCLGRYQEFSVYQNMMKLWIQTIALEMTAGIAGLILLFEKTLPLLRKNSQNNQTY